MDKFQQLGFNHDIHSTTNVNQTLNKLPTPVRLEWNKHVLERSLLQPSLKELSEWILIYAKACRDLPTSCASAQPPSTHSKASNNLWKQSNQQTQFNRPSNRSHQDQRTKPSNSFQPSSEKGVVCPNNGRCQYLYKCSHFQDLSPLDRREHVKKLKLCFNCFGSHHVQQCTSKNVCRSADCGKKHHTMIHENFLAKNQALRPSSTVKSVQLHGTGQVAFLPVQLSNGEKTIETYSYLNNGSCQSLLLQSAALILGIDMNTFGKMSISGYHTTKEIDCSPVSLKIKPYQSNKTPILVNQVLAVPDLNMNPVNTNELNKLCKKIEHLKHISFPNIDENKVSIFIGIDNLELIHYSKVIKGPKNTPWVVETSLG